MKRAILDDLTAARKNRVACLLVTRLRDGAQILWKQGDAAPDGICDADIAQALRHDKSTALDAGEERYFLHVHNPSLRLIVVGAVHITQHLVRMGTELDYDVTVIDPRRAWATAERFPATQLDRRWPDEAMAALKPDHRSAVVTLTHDPKLDDPALQAALASEAFYVGALGSRKTHAKRVARLTGAGIAEDQIGRLSAPVGLNIGAAAPAEIALSIMAQITLALRGTKP